MHFMLQCIKTTFFSLLFSDFILSLFPSKVRAYFRCRMRWCPSSALHLLRCVRFRSCTRRGRNTVPLWIREIWAYMKLLVHSFYFNSLTDSDVVFDSIFEPVFFTVDYVTRWFGTVSVCFCLCALSSYRELWSFSLMKVLCGCLSPVFVSQVFVFLVVILTSSIVLIAYGILLPLVLNTYSPVWIAWHVCFGHWIIVMIAFHYYKATQTPPGYPPTVRYQIHFSAEKQRALIICAWI